MKKKKAKLYERVASAHLPDQERAIKEQHRLLTAYCAENNIEITGIYVDNGASGNHVDRPAFRKMLADLMHPDNETNLILFTSWDRFCRDHEITKSVMNLFEQMDVKLEAITIPGTMRILEHSIMIKQWEQ